MQKIFSNLTKFHIQVETSADIAHIRRNRPGWLFTGNENQKTNEPFDVGKLFAYRFMLLALLAECL